jgi:peptidyl-prolyl cis-trans isomerase D
MRQSSRNFLIYLLFAIVIAVFIVNFGPQSAGGCDAPTGDGAYAARVRGHELTPNDFRYGYLMTGGGQVPADVARAQRLKERVMDQLIERELLASEAERLGLRVSAEEAEDLIGSSRLVAMGFEQPAMVFQKDGRFDYEQFRRFVQFSLQMTPKQFVAEQQREILALRMREILRNGANVSQAEVKAEFERQGNQVNLEYMRFSARRYEAEIEPTAEEIKAFADTNEKKLKELYDQRKYLYEKAPKERRLSQIVLKVAADAKPELDAAVKARADKAAERVKKGEAFAAVAKVETEDARGKTRGGALGWRRQGTTGLGTTAEEKVWAAKDGEVVGPIKGTDGWYLVLVEGTREGNIPFEAVRLELAEDQLKQDKAKTRAIAEAEAALVKARAANDKPLKDLFPAPAGEAKEDRPTAEETGLFSQRGAVVEGIGSSAALARAAFALTTEQPFAGPFEVAGSHVIVKLKEKKAADLAEFEKKKTELVTGAARQRGEMIADDWALRRCSEAKGAKEIEVNRDLLRYEDGPEAQPIAYEPCTPPPAFAF